MTIPESIQSLIDDTVKLYAIHIPKDVKDVEFHKAVRRIATVLQKHAKTIEYIKKSLDDN